MINGHLVEFCYGVPTLGIDVASYGAMKKIEAIIRLSKLNEVQDALEDIGIDRMTTCEVREFSRQNLHNEIYRGKEYTLNYLPMVRIDLVVADQFLDQTVRVIIQSAKTGAMSDGNVFISDVKEAAYPLTI